MDKMNFLVKQPFHDLCEEIYTQVFRLGDILENLRDNKVISAYEQIQEIKFDLEKTLTKLRERALKEEGKRIV